MRRLLALLVLIGLCFSPSSSLAVEGKVGNLTWSLSDDGQLNINGRGKIPNYSDSAAPWGEYHEQIRTIVIGEGITAIGDGAFTTCDQVSSVSFPNSLKVINWKAFRGCRRILIVTLPHRLSTNAAPIKAEKFSVKVGKKRGNGTRTIRVVENETSFEGIVDYKHHVMLWPQEGIEIYAVDDTDNKYYGGRNTGIYWIFNCQDEKYAFWDVPSGYFSGYLFHESQDLIFDDSGTDFLRVTEDGHQFYYINRRNGERLSPICFSGINTSGMYKGYAIETIFGTGETVVINVKGQIYRVPAGFYSVNDRIEKGILYLESKEGGTLKIKMNESLPWENTK